MAGASEAKDVKSPQDIEEGVKSTPTVTWDPFTVFPKEIYVKIFDKLDSPTDKQNFMNAHVKWYELFESERTLFLFEDVLKELTKNDLKCFIEIDWERAFKDYKNCSFVCRDWNRGAQHYFQLNDCYFSVEDESRMFDGRYAYEPSNSFFWFTASEAEKDLEKFSVTHPPSRNPFFSSSVTLFPVSDARLLRPMAIDKAFDKMMARHEEWGEANERNWGREYADIEKEFQEAEYTERYWASVEAILDRYGRHLWHCRFDIREKLNPEVCLVIAKWLDLIPELKTLELYHPELKTLDWSCFQSLTNTNTEWNLKAIESMQLAPLELKNLVFLKSTRLPPIVFNKLFGKLSVEKIQIDIKCCEGIVFGNFEFESKNLKEASLTLKGLNDYKYLQNSEPFLTLRKLVIAFSFETYKCLECQLNLPKLKKLWVALPNLCSLDFIYPCRALEELRVILKHSGWGYRTTIGLRSGRCGDKVIFNSDLDNMLESSIWKAFPKLRVLKAWIPAGF